MSDVWFTSDTHFYHDRVLEFCEFTRRGKDSEEMTNLMVDAWNNVVKPGDTVYHLGDFSFKSKEHCVKVKNRLNGQIHLILGNHDKHIEKRQELKNLFTHVSFGKNVRVGEHKFNMSHEPKAEWVDCHKGVIHLHGHLHGNKQNTAHQQRYRIFDVGIDARPDNKMIPWHIDEVLYFMKYRDIMSHH